MERGSITKWLFVALAIFLVIRFAPNALFPKKATEHPAWSIKDETTAPAESRAPAETCTIDAPSFKAELSTQGASLRHLTLKDKRYTQPMAMPGGTLAGIKHLIFGEGKISDVPMDLVSTTREGRSPLRVDLRAPRGDSVKQQVAYDDLDWKLTASDGKSCTFTFTDATTSLEKTVALGDDPYELTVDVKVTNLASEPRVHRFAIEQTDWRKAREMEGHLGRQSEFDTEVVTVATKTERFKFNDFEAGDFAKPEFTPEKWRRAPGEGKLAAVSSAYFTKLVIPTQGPGAPVSETLVYEVWQADRFRDKASDPDNGYVYRARVAYPEKELAPKESVTYRALSFTGPKERDLLARINHGATEVLNLGTFATIASTLVKYLRFLYGITKSWGWAIVLLTITVRMVLFPLSLSQIKSSMAMRRLKPEMDALNEKYKDDAAQRGLAIQELWRKNGVTNPVLGCLPMLLQMPVWWALYTALQTAVELYHVPFGPVIPDLSAPGLYLIIPAVLGASSFFQQKLMPQQGDPAQQKMMMYMMPSIFTFMMLFLPAGLGVYMVTNSVLAIVQQLLVERYLKANAAPSGQIEVRDKTSGDGGKPPPALGKGKARARG
jgi:YidC/Oxa1 family membrane protein insertase